MQNQINQVFIYLCVNNAQAALEFYSAVFGSKEDFRLTEPGGRVGHLELSLGNTTLMLSEEFPEMGILSPKPDEAKSTMVHLHVDNCDLIGSLAEQHGAKLIQPPTDQFYGERSCTLLDPFGHRWLVGHSIEKVEVEEMQRRYQAMFE